MQSRLEMPIRLRWIGRTACEKLASRAAAELRALVSPVRRWSGGRQRTNEGRRTGEVTHHQHNHHQQTLPQVGPSHERWPIGLASPLAFSAVPSCSVTPVRNERMDFCLRMEFRLRFLFSALFEHSPAWELPRPTVPVQASPSAQQRHLSWPPWPGPDRCLRRSRRPPQPWPLCFPSTAPPPPPPRPPPPLPPLHLVRCSLCLNLPPDAT